MQTIKPSLHLLLVELVSQKKKRKTSSREKENKDHQRSSTPGHYSLKLSKQAWCRTRQVVPNKVNTDAITQTSLGAMFNPNPPTARTEPGSWHGPKVSDLSRWYIQPVFHPFYNLLLLKTSLTSVKG